MLASPIFIITIDTEGDNIWACPEKVTTENVRYLPRFQNLCEEYGLKPTYLVNYEMVVDRRFQEFGRSILRREAGEIGLHVHPWNSPPLAEAADGNHRHHTYLYEFSDAMIYAKIAYLTRLLIDAFNIRPVSHRAGRWGFNDRVAQVLAETGYLVDCSVTSGLSWRKYRSVPDGQGGPDYFGFPNQPYFLDLNNIRQPGQSQLLEVPLTIKPNYQPTMQRLYHAVEDGLIGKVFCGILGRPYTWLRPDGKNLDAMLSLINWAIQRQFPVLEFMLHSSELMPGGSPTFKTAQQIESLFEHLRKLFAYLARRAVPGMTLAEYRSTWG